MFKVEIEAEDGRTLRVSKGAFLFFRDISGKETYYEWEHLKGREKELDPVFDQAGRMLEEIEAFLPSEPYPPLR